MTEINYHTCPYCHDEVQDVAYTMHISGLFKGKKVADGGTCYVLQQRLKEEKK